MALNAKYLGFGCIRSSGAYGGNFREETEESSTVMPATES
jgi:hypothetical protein